MRTPGSRYVATILICVCVLVAQALAQTALKANIPAAPAGGLDPSKLPDIQGIHLGMTPEQVVPIIKAKYPGPGQPTFVNVWYFMNPNVKWVANVQGMTRSDCPPGGQSPACTTTDQISAIFTAPPNKSALVNLYRTISWTGKNPPTVASLDEALKSKYGANPVMRTPYIYTWAFNETGGPLVPAPPVKTLDCGATTLAPVSVIKTYTAGYILPLKQLELTQWMTLRCNNLGVYVRAWINGGPSSPFATSMEVRITDTAEDMRDALAGEAFIEKANADVQKNIQQDTKKNVAPL